MDRATAPIHCPEPVQGGTRGTHLANIHGVGIISPYTKRMRRIPQGSTNVLFRDKDASFAAVHGERGNAPAQKADGRAVVREANLYTC
jgi:hypothetical protein